MHGFNIIFDEEDLYLRDIMELVFNLDLLTKEITMITIDKETKVIHYDQKIKLEEIKKKMDSFNVQVKRVDKYMHEAWYTSY